MKRFTVAVVILCLAAFASPGYAFFDYFFGGSSNAGAIDNSAVGDLRAWWSGNPVYQFNPYYSGSGSTPGTQGNQAMGQQPSAAQAPQPNVSFYPPGVQAPAGQPPQQAAYGPPPQQYQAPQQAYQPPPQAYQAPQQAYQPPPQGYAPQQAYRQPPQGYGAPAGYQPQQQAYQGQPAAADLQWRRRDVWRRGIRSGTANALENCSRERVISGDAPSAWHRALQSGSMILAIRGSETIASR